MKPSELLNQANAVLDNGVRTREAYLTAVPMVCGLREHAKSLANFAKQLREAADELVNATAAYAIDHATALDTPLSEWKDGIERGTVVIDGREYALTISANEIRRISGGNFTQQFLAGLPDDWTAEKLELRRPALKDATADELEAHDLVRVKTRDWSRSDTVTKA
jgi:hypothetical protein